VPTRASPYAVAGRKWLPDFIAKVIFGKPLAPSPDEWARVGEALREGDPPMDELVAWMFDGPPAKAKALFEQALMSGIETVDNPPAPLRRFFELVDKGPAWLDRSQLNEGARAQQFTGMAGFYVLRDMALMGGYTYFNSMNQTLAATGALSKNVALRLGETGKWLADATKPDGLLRFGDGFITTIRVRMVHALVRRALTNKKTWDEDTWGVPINQIDMLATYLAFGPVTIIGARLFGVPITSKEASAAMHMWRYTGWLMGVDDRWLAVGEGDGLRKLYHSFLTHRWPDEKVGLFGAALLREPFTRRIPSLQRFPFLLKLARRYIYAKHVSNSSLILGPVQRRRLGVPMFALPWYPILSAPVRLAVLGLYRLRGRAALQKLIDRRVAANEQLLASYFKNGDIHIIRPTAEHPAHVA
jgi:hypothetical protein